MEIKKQRLFGSMMRPYQCELCKWSFKQNVHLKRHVENVHKDGKSTIRDNYECVECNKRYTSLKNLITHEAETHQHPDGLICHFCKRKHADLDGLMRHYEFAHSSLLAVDEVQAKDPKARKAAMNKINKMQPERTSGM